MKVSMAIPIFRLVTRLEWIEKVQRRNLSRVAVVCELRIIISSLCPLTNPLAFGTALDICMPPSCLQASFPGLVCTNDYSRGVRTPVYQNTIRKFNHNADQGSEYDEAKG